MDMDAYASRAGGASNYPAAGPELEAPLLGTVRVTSESTDASEADGRLRSSLAERISLSIKKCCSRRDRMEDDPMISSPIIDDDSNCRPDDDRDFDSTLLPFTDAEAIFYSVAVGLFCGVFTAAFIAVLKV